jgi:radical SAM superfamily enzyme YgiQ (UPF0313 family)
METQVMKNDLADITPYAEQAMHDKRFRFRVVAPAYPAFNIYSNIAKITTALGPLCIATIANKMEDWDVEAIDENNYRRFGPRDSAGLPDHETLQTIRKVDVVGFYGGLTSTIPRLYELARFYHNRGVITVAGGQHFADEYIEHALHNGVDYVVLGEGDETIRDLLTAIRFEEDPERVAGIAFLRDGRVITTAERPPLTDFAALPLPDFSLLRYARIKLYPISWTRGCCMNCEFCTVKGKPRAAPPERVVEQIATLLEKHNARHFFIVDDLFVQNRKDALWLCDMLASYQRAVGTRLDFTVQIRLDRARDTELLRAMRNAGINTVAVGYESPIAEELDAMKKKIRPENMLSLTREFHKAGFLVHGMFIFGYPMAPGSVFSMTAKERVKRFREFIRKARLDTVQILLPVPLPGTELTRRLAKDNRVFPVDCVGLEYYDGNFPLFNPDPPLTAAEMQASIRKIMGFFYRFRHMFSIALNVLSFPVMVFSLWNIRFGWRKWYRYWRNDLIRFGGWIIIRRWTSQFKKGTFSEKLREAERNIGGSQEAG